MERCPNCKERIHIEQYFDGGDSDEMVMSECPLCDFPLTMERHVRVSYAVSKQSGTRCCYSCGAVLTIDANCGPDIVQGRDVADLLGQRIYSHHFGNCHSCWAKAEFINGELSQTLMIPTKAMTPGEEGEE